MWVLRRISAAFAAKSGALEAHLRPAGHWSEETEEGHPPSRTAGGPGGGLTGLCRRFPLPPVGGGKCQFRPRRKGGESASSDPAGKGGESASSDPAGKGGKVPSLALAEISRRWRLRGGAVWRQRGFAFLRPIPPPKLEAPRQYQAQRGLF